MTEWAKDLAGAFLIGGVGVGLGRLSAPVVVERLKRWFFKSYVEKTEEYQEEIKHHQQTQSLIGAKQLARLDNIDNKFDALLDQFKKG